MRAQKSAEMAILMGNTPELSLKTYQIKMADKPTIKENFSRLSGFIYSPLKSVKIKIIVGLTMKTRVSILVTSSAVGGVISQKAKPMMLQINHEIRLGFTVPRNILIT